MVVDIPGPRFDLPNRPETSASPLDAYRDTRALVLGGAGFIGRWVARGLARAGADLHVVVRDRARGEVMLARMGSAVARVHELDLARLDMAANLLEELRPTITFNLAGYGVDPSERDEAEATRTNAALPAFLASTLAALRQAAPRAGGGARPRWAGRALVHAGSALEYGQTHGDLSEDGPCAPTTLYGRTKLRGTELLALAATSASLPSLVARLFTVYGPGEHAGRLLPALVAAAKSGADLPLTAGTQQRDFALVEDVAEGLLRLGLAPGSPGEVVNLATGRLASVREFALAAARVLGIPAERLRFGELSIRGEEMRHDPVRVEHLRALAGWLPEADLEAGIRRALGSGIEFE